MEMELVYSALTAVGRVRTTNDHHGVSYRLVCAQCRQRYREEGLVLEDHHAVVAWLSGRGDDAQPVV